MPKNEDFKLKFIFPCQFEYYTPHAVASRKSLPYGMAVLTAFLRQKNYYVEQEDFAIKSNYYNTPFLSFALKIVKDILLNRYRNYSALRKFIKSGEIEGSPVSSIDKMLNSSLTGRFNVIGFSVFSAHQFLFALLFSQRLKQKTDTITVLGGPFISLFGQFFYSRIFNFVDYIIVGDGRIPMLRLIDYLQGKTPLSNIPNLIYKDNGKVTINHREYYPLEDVPIPDFEGLPINLYTMRQSKESIVLPYQISKSCVRRCSFCTFPEVGKKLEFKSYGKVLTELQQMKEKYNSKMFFFCDELINNSYGYLEGLCDLFIKHKLDISWTTHAKVGNLNSHILRKMKEAGCFSLAFGAESGSDRILESMNKGFTAEQASRTIRDAAEAGLKITVSLITGYPHETQEDIAKTAEFIKKNKKYIHKAYVYSFSLGYGSPMYLHPARYGIENIVAGRTDFSFAFDESGGLKWAQKQKQQKNSYRTILKIVYTNVKSNKKHQLLIFYCFTLFLLIIVRIKKAKYAIISCIYRVFKKYTEKCLWKKKEYGNAVGKEA